MKLLGIILSLILLSNSAWATNWCDDSNTIACWTMEEGSGTITDHSSNSYNATLTGTSAWSSSDLLDSGDDFSGTTTYNTAYDGFSGYADTNYFATTSAKSLIFWQYPRGTADQVTGSHDGSNRYYLGLQNLTGKLFAGYGNSYTDSYTPTYSINNWYNFAMTDDSGTVRVYFEGVERATFSATFSATSTLEFRIGSRDFSGSPTYSNAKYDEMMIFGDTLSSTDINDIMDNGLSQEEASRRRLIIIQ